MRTLAYRSVLPVAMQEMLHESNGGGAYGAMLDSMCRVVSVCLPIFDLAMKSLAESAYRESAPRR